MLGRVSGDDGECPDNVDQGARRATMQRLVRVLRSGCINQAGWPDPTVEVWCDAKTRGEGRSEPHEELIRDL